MKNKNKKSTLSSFQKNIDKYKEFASWVIWYPDLFLDLIKPAKGGITLHYDQRVFLRCVTRFFSTYGCFPRGYGKTYLEVLANIIIAIRYPGIDLALTAQTKENAADILKDKINEILNHFPLLKNELAKEPRGSKNDFEILFKNNSRINILANAQTSKGQRRKRLSIEEAALLNNELFEDALKPIVEVPRYTIGKLSIVDPEELNQQINFYTTPGWRGSDEHKRNLDMIANMRNLSGDMVIGADWKLCCWYGRGSIKPQILQKMRTMSPVSFAQNYGGQWTGSSSGALVNINKLMECRTLTTPELRSKNNNDEYYMGVDVARSQNSANNQSSIVVGKVKRGNKNNRVTKIEIVNIINIPNVLNFTTQAIIVKKTKLAFNAKMVVVDGNGLGAGLIDELLKETYDPITNESLGCWNTINTTNEPETDDAELCLYDLKSTGNQSKIVTTFIDFINSKRLRFLENKPVSIFDEDSDYAYQSEILPFLQTNLLMEEISNLKVKHMPNGGLSVSKVVSRLDKDRYSALAYMIWYINEYENSYIRNEEIDLSEIHSLVSKLII